MNTPDTKTSTPPAGATPRTDAQIYMMDGLEPMVHADFARQLETELEGEHADVRKCEAIIDDLHKQLAEAKEDSRRLDWLMRYWDSQCTGLQPFGLTGYYPNTTGSYRAAIDAAREANWARYQHADAMIAARRGNATDGCP